MFELVLYSALLRESYLHFIVYKLVCNTSGLVFAQMELRTHWRFYGTLTEFYKKGRKINKDARRNATFD